MDNKNFNYSRFFIRNCDFRLQCHQSWEGLESKKGDQSIRYCSECKKDVHFVQNAWELVMAVEKDFCVAVPRTLVIGAKAVLGKDKPLLGHVQLPRKQ